MAVIDRATDASSLIPEDYQRGIVQPITEKSAALSLIPTVPMSARQQRMSVLATFPIAAFVTGSNTDVGLKATTNMTWANVFMTAEPIAVIVPIAEDLVDDIGQPIWAQVKPRLVEAIAAVIDAAVYFGVGAPASWTSPSIVPGAVAAGNTVAAGTGVDIAADMNAAMGAVEADGFYPDGWYWDLRERVNLRGLRDANRQFLFNPSGPSNTGVASAGDRRMMEAGYQGPLYGLPSYTSALGLASFGPGVSGNTRYVTGDWDQSRIGMRKDIEFKMLDQAALFNPDGTLMFNLPQQDMVALRVVTRVGYVTPNPATRTNPNAGTRWPYAVVRIP